VCDSTTVNLHKLLAFGARLAAPRGVIVAERYVFPTDLYVVQGLVQQSGGALELRLIDRPEDLPKALGPDVAVVCLSYVDYRSSRRWNMAEVNRAVHAAGGLTLWDLSHGAGAVGIDLNGSGADLAVGCGYKYLSGGPGAPALLYVAERHRKGAWPAIPGWFGHADPFVFAEQYEPHPGVERHLSGSPAVLASVAFRAMTQIWKQVSAAALDKKHRSLSAVAMELADAWCAPFGVTVASPRNHDEQGGHVALTHPDAAAITQALLAEGVVCSFRKPDSIRFGIGPLALRHEDVWNAVARLRTVLKEEKWKKLQGGKRLV
jgi:kynureninase